METEIAQKQNPVANVSPNAAHLEQGTAIQNHAGRPAPHEGTYRAWKVVPLQDELVKKFSPGADSTGASLYGVIKNNLKAPEGIAARGDNARLMIARGPRSSAIEICDTPSSHSSSSASPTDGTRAAPDNQAAPEAPLKAEQSMPANQNRDPMMQLDKIKVVCVGKKRTTAHFFIALNNLHYGQPTIKKIIMASKLRPGEPPRPLSDLQAPKDVDQAAHQRNGIGVSDTTPKRTYTEKFSDFDDPSLNDHSDASNQTGDTFSDSDSSETSQNFDSSPWEEFRNISQSGDDFLEFTVFEGSEDLELLFQPEDIGEQVNTYLNRKIFESSRQEFPD